MKHVRQLLVQLSHFSARLSTSECFLQSLKRDMPLQPISITLQGLNLFGTPFLVWFMVFLNQWPLQNLVCTMSEGKYNKLLYYTRYAPSRKPYHGLKTVSLFNTSHYRTPPPFYSDTLACFNLEILTKSKHGTPLPASSYCALHVVRRGALYQNRQHLIDPMPQRIHQYIYCGFGKSLWTLKGNAALNLNSGVLS